MMTCAVNEENCSTHAKIFSVSGEKCAVHSFIIVLFSGKSVLFMRKSVLSMVRSVQFMKRRETCSWGDVCCS